MDENVLNSLCGNKQIYNNIFNWLQSNFQKKSAFVVGNSCIGKTYSIRKLCTYLDYDISEIDSNNCYDSTAFKDLIYKASTSRLIQSIENTYQKKIIIIDNFDVLYYSDKSIKASLLKIISGNMNIPIICIVNPDVYKKIGDVKKFSEVFELCNPTDTEIIFLLKKMHIKPKKIKQLLKNTDNNLTRIFELLHNNTNIDYSCNDCRYDIMYLYNNVYDRNIITNVILPDPWQIPLRFHENLITELLNRSIRQDQLNKVYAFFMINLCQYDLFMYKNHTEIAVDFFSSAIYSIICIKSKKKKITVNKFTKILSYLSLQKKYSKNLYTSDFPFYQIGNYHTTLLDRKFICFN